MSGCRPFDMPFLPAPRAWRRLAAPALVAVAAALAACADAGTDPGEPASVAFNRLPSPSIVVGDTLRDLEGNVVDLRDSVRVFDADQDQILDFPVSFLVANPSARVRYDAESGFLISVDTTSARTVAIQATAGRLVPPALPLAIVPNAPTRITRPDTNTVRLAFGTTNRQAVTEFALQALLRTADDTAEVSTYPVEYRVISTPASLDSVAFVAVRDTALRVFSPFDTTESSGIASRFLRATIRDGAANGTDVVVVEARFRVRTTVVSTLRFDVPVVIARGTATQ